MLPTEAPKISGMEVAQNRQYVILEQLRVLQNEQPEKTGEHIEKLKKELSVIQGLLAQGYVNILI